MRDLDHNNYIFIGSPGSNPWVTLLQDKLNFRESEVIVGKSPKVFLNKNPLPGEQLQYEGLRWTGTMGEDYATISLLPNATDDGSVLAFQGLQQEGTEAAGRFLADEENRRQLMSALGISAPESRSQSIWFEALIRSRTVSGAPNSATLVAVRQPDSYFCFDGRSPAKAPRISSMRVPQLLGMSFPSLVSSGLPCVLLYFVLF
jgi:hypothetical protein